MFISRVNTWWTKLIYMLCLFAMVVPFQMEMYTLSKIANMLRLNTPWGLIFIYLGFGAGLGGIYVYRIYEVHSTGDRRGGND